MPCDLGIIHASPEKMLRFGYFPETREYVPAEPFSRKKKGSILWAARMIDWKHPELVVKTAAYLKEHLEEIDAQLNSASRGWKTKRMSRVDLAALRLAVYEMEYDADVPTGVAINEAVELAKRFGGDASGSFVNGVLGKIASEKDEKKNEEETADTEEKAAEAPEENA